MNWGWAIKIWGFHHATPTHTTHIPVYPLSQITLFWEHCLALNFLLVEDLQPFFQVLLMEVVSSQTLVQTLLNILADCVALQSTRQNCTVSHQTTAWVFHQSLETSLNNSKHNLPKHFACFSCSYQEKGNEVLYRLFTRTRAWVSSLHKEHLKNWEDETWDNFI